MAVMSLSSKTQSAYVPLFSVDIRRAHDIPRILMELVKILEEQPVFEGRGFILDEQGFKIKKYKVIALSDLVDARIFGIFNANLRNILEDKKPQYIHEISDGNCQLFDSKEERIRQGISLWLDDEIEMCSYEALENSYDTVFSAMISGWKKADLKDYPQIMFTENPKEFDLFIKDRALIEEEILVRFMAKKFFLEDSVVCQNEWLMPEGFCYVDRIYLWVRRTELSRTVEKMSLNLYSFDLTGTQKE